MDNYFSIANSILNGSLRPWIKENQQEDKFRHLLNAQLRINKNNPVEFCRSTVKAFKDLNFEIENDNLEELKELAQVKITSPFEIEKPQFYNKQTEFYAYLIANTSHCILDGVKATMESSDEIGGTYKLYLLLNKLESVISTINTNPQSSIPESFVPDTLSLYLFVIHSTLKKTFNTWIDFETLSENELLYQLCPKLAADKSDSTKLAYFLNAYIKQRDNPAEDKVVEERLAPPEKISFESFRYIDYDTKPDSLTDLCDSLKKSGFIHDDTTTVNFKKVFSGKEINAPVVWTGNPSEFYYFIKLIHNEHKLVANLKQDQWKVAIQCFIREDGSKFKNSVRKLDRPSKTGDKLDKAVSLLF